MRIGSRQAPQTASTYSRARATPEDFGAGVATALGALGGSISDYGMNQADMLATMREREDRMRRSNQEVELIRWEGEQRRAVSEMRATVEPGAAGLTNQTYEQLGASYDELADRLGMTEEDRQHFGPRFETFRQTSVTQSFAVEFEEQNRNLMRGINQVVDQARADIHQTPLIFQERWSDIERLIDESDLPPLVQEELRQESFNAIARTAYASETALALQDQLPVGEPTGADVVAPGTGALMRGFLNTTSSVESNGYDEMYGGGRFTGYHDHPRQAHRITSGPNAGQNSTAAGRYQFLASTWDFVRESMEAEGYDFGPEPFSPVNQDRAAIWYANHRYRNAARSLGLPPEMHNLENVLASGDPAAYAQVRRILSGEAGTGVVWEGFQHLTDEQFYSRIRGGAERGAIGTRDRPDIWNDPRFADLPFDARLELDTEGARLAAARQRQRQEARDEQESEAMNSIRNMFAQGDGEQAYSLFRQLSDAGVINRAENIERGERLGIEYREAFDAAASQSSRRSLGHIATPADADSLDAEARFGRVLQGMQERSPEAAARILENMRADGMIAPTIMGQAIAQLQSGDSQHQIYALELLSDLYSVNPRGTLRGLERNQAEDVVMASTLARFSRSPQEFIDHFNQLRGPQGAQFRRQRLEEADELLGEISTEQFFDQMHGFWNQLRTGAELPGPGQLPQFDEDARNLFRSYYAVFGDKTQAMDATANMLQHSYTPSPLSNRLMQYSPTSPIMGVPPLDESHAWIAPHTRSFVDSFVEAEVGRITEGLIAAGLPEDVAASEAQQALADISTDSLELIPDPQTLEDRQRGEPPSYQIGYIDRNGMPRVLYDSENRPVRIPLAPPQEDIDALNLAITHQHSLDRQERAMQELETLRRIESAAERHEELRGEVEVLAPEGETALTPEEREARRQDLEGVIETERAAHQRRVESAAGDLVDYSTDQLIRMRRSIESRRTGVEVMDGARPRSFYATEQILLDAINETLRRRADNE